MEIKPYYDPTTTLLPDKRLAEVFRKLENLPPGIYPITDTENIPYIKQYIDCHHDVDFNSDYSKLRKLNPIRR